MTWRSMWKDGLPYSCFVAFTKRSAHKAPRSVRLAQCDRCPQVLSTNDWSLAIGIALLGGDDGGPRSGAVGGAKRSGPPVRSVDGRAHPPEPRMRSIGVDVDELVSNKIERPTVVRQLRHQHRRP